MVIKVDKANQPSEYVLKRSAKMTARILAHFDEGEEVTEVEVNPNDPEKATRIVSFEKRKGEIHIVCFEKESLKNCPANQHALYCSHVETAIRELLSAAAKGESDVTEQQK